MVKRMSRKRMSRKRMARKRMSRKRMSRKRMTRKKMSRKKKSIRRKKKGKMEDEIDDELAGLTGSQPEGNAGINHRPGSPVPSTTPVPPPVPMVPIIPNNTIQWIPYIGSRGNFYKGTQMNCVPQKR